MTAGRDITKGIMFKRQAKGASNIKPKEPKYDDMWDLGVLFEYFKNPLWPGRPNIAMRCKANVLVRASVAGRNKDVAHIFYDSVVWTDTSVTFRLYKWKNKHNEGVKLSRPMTIEKLPSSKQYACAFTALREYMTLHQQDYIRLKPKGIWLNFHGTAEISHSTLANDCRVLLNEVGIPKAYGAATIRHAAITFWRELGIPLEVVMDRTGHRSGALVLKYYDKSSSSYDIMASILKDTESDDEGEYFNESM
jgi:hypothetical protein